jgi:hypothetical protein
MWKFIVVALLFVSCSGDEQPFVPPTANVGKGSFVITPGAVMWDGTNLIAKEITIKVVFHPDSTYSYTIQSISK